MCRRRRRLILLAEVTRLATFERHATAQLVASLAELDARRLYLGRGFSSMFTYCGPTMYQYCSERRNALPFPLPALSSRRGLTSSLTR